MGATISAPVVYDYLRHITDACVCDKVSRYDIRGKKVLSFEEKIYVQAAYLLADDVVIEREFGAYSDISDNYPKYVVTMDKITFSRDGIRHVNLIDFCMGER